MGIRNSIASALPDLIAREALLRSRASALGITYDIANFGGVRTLADTVLILGYRAADYAAAAARDPSVADIPINEWRPIASYGSSYHNYGAAFDVVITGTPNGVSETAALLKLKTLAPSVGLRSTVPYDPPHFELPITLEQAKALWQEYAPTQTGNVAAASTVLVLIGAALAITYLRRRT